MKKISTLGIVCLVVLVTVPNLALASWWNPLSWFSHSTAQTPLISDYSTKTTGANTELKASTPKVSQGQTIKKKVTVNKSAAVVPQTTPVITTPLPAPVVVAPQDPSKTAMAQLLQNPTFDNLKSFCVQAKNLQGYTTKQTLDPTRTQMISVTDNLYEDTGCAILEKDFVVYSLPDSSLSLSFQDSDTDLVRETKITYNNNLTTLSQSAKFVIFLNPFSGSNPPTGVDPHSVVSVANYYLNQLAKIPFSMINQRRLTQLPQESVTGALYDPIANIRKLYENE